MESRGNNSMTRFDRFNICGDATMMSLLRCGVGSDVEVLSKKRYDISVIVPKTTSPPSSHDEELDGLKRNVPFTTLLLLKQTNLHLLDNLWSEISILICSIHFFSSTALKGGLKSKIWRALEQPNSQHFQKLSCTTLARSCIYCHFPFLKRQWWRDERVNTSQWQQSFRRNLNSALWKWPWRLHCRHHHNQRHVH